MAQPFDVSGSKGGGRSFGRRPIVLARLPRVAAGARTLAMTPPQALATFAEATRFYVDPHHATAVAAADEVEQHSQQHGTPDQRRRHGPHRHSSRPSQPAIAASLPVRLASYSGLATTLVLAASVVLLYWMIIAPGQTPTADFANSYDTIGTTRIEIPYFEVSAPPPSPPRAETLAKTRFATVDPFKNDATAAEATAPAAEVVPAHSAPTLTAAAAPTAENQAAAEASTPPAQPTTDLVPLPEIVPSPTTTPEVIYNDASAAAYPTTDHPLASHITVLGISALGPLEPAPRDAGPHDGAKFFPVPQMTRQPSSNSIR